MTADPVEVLVVGAGPTGLALALQAHDHGARVRVLERRVEAFRPSRALVMHPRTLEALRPLGVTDALLARSDASAVVHLHLGRRLVPVRVADLDLPETAFPHLLLLRQNDVEAVLSRALSERGVEVERGAELVGLGRDGGQPCASVDADGTRTRVAYRYLAGCDGAASTVRTSSGVAWRGGSYRHEVVLADLELDGDLAPGVAHAVAGRAGLLFLFAVGEQATWRLLATRTTGRDGLPPGQTGPPVSLAELQALLDGAGLAARITHVGWSATVRLQHRLAAQYRCGAAFLVGDAAHTHSPAAAQGMNTGIQDGLNLGWKLAFAARAGTDEAVREVLLGSYEQERRPVARQVLALTHLVFWAEAGTDPLASFIRASLVPVGAPVMPLLLRRRHLVAAAMRIVSQVGVTYRDSPLSVDGERPSRGEPTVAPRPGERLPDADVVVEGRRVRLHDTLARPGVHVLLARDAAKPGAAGPGPDVHVVRVASWPGAAVLGIRPDGYVGYRAGRLEPAELARWLALTTARPGARVSGRLRRGPCS